MNGFASFTRNHDGLTYWYYAVILDMVDLMMQGTFTTWVARGFSVRAITPKEPSNQPHTLSLGD